MYESHNFINNLLVLRYTVLFLFKNAVFIKLICVYHRLQLGMIYDIT